MNKDNFSVKDEHNVTSVFNSFDNALKYLNWLAHKMNTEATLISEEDGAIWDSTAKEWTPATPVHDKDGS